MHHTSDELFSLNQSDSSDECVLEQSLRTCLIPRIMEQDFSSLPLMMRLSLTLNANFHSTFPFPTLQKNGRK